MGINLTSEIFSAILNRECDPEKVLNGVPCPQDFDDNGDVMASDDQDSFDTLQEYAVLIAGVLSMTFLILPYGLNLKYAISVPTSPEISNNKAALNWFERYQMLFIGLVILSGGCYPTLYLVSSNLFGLSLLNTGLSSFELSGLSSIRVITTVLTENGPQLIVQLLYVYSIGGDFTQNTILAFSTSVMSIVSSVLNYCIDKDKEGQTQDVFYYFQLSKKEKKNTKDTNGKKKKKKRPSLTKKERQIINQRKGITLELEKKIVKIYDDVDIAHFEIGNVTLRKDNFFIRVCQHLHEQDLNVNVDDDYNDITDPKERAELRAKPYQNHCYELFASNKTDIEDIIFEHYGDLKRKKFEIQYFKKYPTGNKNDAMLGEGNIRGFLRHSSQKSIAFGDSLANFDGNDEEEEDDEGDGTKKKTKKEKAESLTEQHRYQFNEALAILRKEIERYHKTHDKTAPIPKMRINKFVRVMQEKFAEKLQKNLHHAIINDVLKFAACSGLYVKDEKHDSDIDSSDESDQWYQDDAQFMFRMKQIAKNNEVTRQIPEYNETNKQFLKRIKLGRMTQEQKQQEKDKQIQYSVLKQLNDAKQQKKQKKKKKKKVKKKF